MNKNKKTNHIVAMRADNFYQKTEQLLDLKPNAKVG